MPEGALYNGLLILAAAGGLYVFWMLARKIVKFGFLVMYFLIGAGVTWALNPNMSVSLPIAGGLVFAFAVMSIKAKVWKVVTAAAVLIGASIVLPAFLEGTDTARAKEKAKVKKSTPRLAAKPTPQNASHQR